jgi:glutaredoxin
LDQSTPRKQHHSIEIFSANCPLCKEVTDVIEIGRCQGCEQVVYDTNSITEEIKMKMNNYDIRAVPTTIIDGEIKVVGVPDFPWICGDDLYKMLKAKYPIRLLK